MSVIFMCTVAVTSFAFPVWSGDANGDKAVNARDIILIMKHMLDPSFPVNAEADFNSDGKINDQDIILIMKYILGMNVLTDGLLEVKYGVSEVSFEIPDPTCDKEISGEVFGFDAAAEDNSAAFNAAARHLAENPGTVLRLAKGTYRMGDAVVMLSKIKNCVIDGAGSTLLFDEKRYFSISECENLKITNITIDWDWDRAYLASIAKVKDVSAKDESGKFRAELEFLEKDASYALSRPWDSMIYLDPEELTMNRVGKGDHYNVDDVIIEKTLKSPNVIEVLMKADAIAPTKGETLLIRHENYGSTMFPIANYSHDIVLEDVTIYGVAGCGINIASGSHHVRMTRLTVGLNPETADMHRISTTADAIHIKDTGGYFILEDSDISFNGDDCLNIHDCVGMLTDFYENTITIRATNTTAFNVGDTLNFRRTGDFSPVDFTAVITDRSVSGKEWTLTLDRDCEDALEENLIVHDMTQDSSNLIVRNCYFHENRARGLLLGSSNCIVENCKFYRIQQQAINIPIDIIVDVWQEGKGTSNMIIRNNEFDGCNALGADEASCISIFTNITSSDPKIQSGVIQGKCYENLMISGNVFRNLPGYMLKAISVDNLTVYQNTVEFPESVFEGFREINSGRITLRGAYYDNSRIFGNTWNTNGILTEPFDPVRINPSKVSTVTVEKNTIN